MTHYSTLSSSSRQRGAALLTAMVIVTLVTTIASSMVWQQWRAVQVESAERARAQSYWMLRGALDFGRHMLIADKPEVDHGSDMWAAGLAETRVSSFLAVDKNNNAADEESGPEAFLSGNISDLQAKYNLTNLLKPDGAMTPIPEQVAILKRLCESASLSRALADEIAEKFQRAKLTSRLDDPEAREELGEDERRDKAPLLPQTVDQLVWLGLDAGTIERLRPFVTLLPTPTTVNINTAPREVLAAVLDIDLGRADGLVRQRQRNPFDDVTEVQQQLGLLVELNPVSMNSSYFQIEGRLRLDNQITEQRYVVQRSGNGSSTVVKVLSEARVSGVDMQATTTSAP